MLKLASKKQRHGIWQRRVVLLALPIFIFVTSIFTLVVLGASGNTTYAATSNTLNFQGRLLTNSGGLVPDGSYSIEFKIYDSAAAGASAPGVCSLDSSTDDCWWRETRTVTVQNGYYSVYLGDTTAGGTAFTAGLPWDQDLWLTMNVNSDGEMTPRFKLTAVPYAFRAGALVDAAGNAKTADQFAQLSPTAVQAVNSAVSALRLAQSGAGGFVQFQNGGSDVFTISNSGATTLGSSTTAGLLTLEDGNGDGTTILAGNSTGDLTFTLPSALGSASQCLKNSTTPGILEFGTCGSSVMPFVSKTKAADETVNNSGVPPTQNTGAGFQNDNDLFFSIGANETWNFRAVLHTNIPAAPDMKITITAPGGATCKFGYADLEAAISLGNLGCAVSTGLIAGTATEELYEVFGSVTNGATAGVVNLQWSQNTANAANTTVRSGSFLEASRSVGGSSADVAFIQDGNTFGGLATLGTNDANGLAFETNGVERMQILSTGELRASDDMIANRIATGTTGTTTGTGTNTTTLNLAADVFAVNDVILIDNVGQDYYTRVTVDPGTGSYTVSPAVSFGNARTVTKYTIQNIGATESDYASQANRFFQGYFLGGVVVGAGSTTISDGNIESTTDLNLQANGGNVTVGGGLAVTGAITGDGSGLTNIDGASISGSTITGLDAGNVATGTINDARLSANVALLTGAQTFTGAKDFSGGVSVSAGNVSVTGTITATGVISGDGSGLTNLSGASINGATITGLDAGNISTGTVNDGRLSANVSLLSTAQTFTGAKDFGAGLTVSGGNIGVTGDITASAQISGATILGDGSGLTNLDAADISSGTINDGRLSGNVALLAGSQTFSGSKTFSGGLVLGQTTLSSAATVARAVSFPDEAGTVCLSNSNTCGYLRFAAGTAQTDASNNDVIAVNKTSATGNLISMQRSATPVFTVANSGALQIQATGTTALDVRNAGGTSYFIVDTNTGRVQIGATTADAVGVLLVLDIKNTVGDPTGVDGAQYYNSATGTFRCDEGVLGWTECLGAPKLNSRRTTTLLANGTGTTLTSTGGDVANVSGTGTASAATTTQPAAVNYATGAGANSDSGISGNTNYNTSANPTMQTNIRLASTTNTRNWVGFTNQTLATMNGLANPAGIYAAFRYDTSAGDVNWQCITKNGGAQSIANSTVAASTANVELEVSIVTGTSVVFKINGAIVCTSITNLPAANTMTRYVASRRNLAAGAQSIQVAWMYLESNQ